MNRVTQHAWAAGLLVGPLFAWLCWAIQRRRIGMIVSASIANIALWLGGGWLITQVAA